MTEPFPFLMNELIVEAARIRREAQKSPQWKQFIDALLESNNKAFEGPISRNDIEDCVNFVLDQYDPSVLIKEGRLKPEDHYAYLEEHDDGNPFLLLIVLDDERKIETIEIDDLEDIELVGQFLSRKYKSKGYWPKRSWRFT